MCAADSSQSIRKLQGIGLSKRFGTYRALDHVSFAVAPGEILGLIGPNGAGKSTLLEGVTGLLPMDAGRVLWGERPLAPAERRQVLWYQPDDVLPFARQPVGITLAFFRRLHGTPAEEFEGLLGDLELGPVLHQPMQTLSKGFRRRALLALALSSRRPVLLLDEPFDGFDLRQSLAVMALLRRFRDDRAMILSIHQLSRAEKICDRFLLLDQGRVLGLGTLDELRDQAGLGPTADLEEVFLALT